VTRRDPDLTHPLELTPAEVETVGGVMDRLRTYEGEGWSTAQSNQTLSTSAQLRQAQAALAASQADLSRVEGELDMAHKALAICERSMDQISAARSAAEKERDLARAELASARQELDTYRDGRLWQVAQQDTGHTCAACSQPITCGQAFQPLADIDGHYSHAYCPNKEG
jgi:hypothetical protein